MYKCSNCDKEIKLFSHAINECPVCKKLLCGECVEELAITIDLEDFPRKVVCLDCYTPEIEKLIKKAENTQDKLDRAKDNHVKACDKLLRKLEGK